jgi:EAL and modified HD-GYP domain-containing signal transduction protein
MRTQSVLAETLPDISLVALGNAAPRAVRYVARQPILATNESVIGYELLFRAGVQNLFESNDPDNATRTVIDMSSLHGFYVLCNRRLAFINCTRETLLEGSINILPPEQVVVEILETVTPEAEVRQACRNLQAAGYQLAFDDFVLDDPREGVAHCADFIKVDLRLVSLDDAAKIAARYRGTKCKLLAEKVETRQDFAFTKRAGFQFFQGYFFRKPEMMRMRSVAANQTVYLRLLRAVTKLELDWREVEDVIKKDATLCLRLLRYLNSAVFGLRNQIRSIRHALAIIGEAEMRRWCRLAAVLEMTHNRPSDLALSALIRARLSELLGNRIDHGKSDLFLLGLLSLMDSILEIPMEMVMEDLPLDREIKTVLLEGTGRLATIHKLVLAVESGDWKNVASMCAQLQLPEEFVAASHWEAMEWAEMITVAA